MREISTRHCSAATGLPSHAGHNGAGYAQNQYDIKLEQAYARLASGSLPNLQLRAAQIALLYLGFSPGKIDGVIGQRTRNALNSFRLQAGLPPGGDLDGPCYVALCQKAGLLP